MKRLPKASPPTMCTRICVRKPLCHPLLFGDILLKGAWTERNPNNVFEFPPQSASLNITQYRQLEFGAEFTFSSSCVAFKLHLKLILFLSLIKYQSTVHLGGARRAVFPRIFCDVVVSGRKSESLIFLRFVNYLRWVARFRLIKRSFVCLDNRNNTNFTMFIVQLIKL